MADHQKVTEPRRLSEVNAHRLLARAAELDARLGASVDADQLRSAALEAGISEEAFAQARQELESGQLDSPTRRTAIVGFLATGGRVLGAAALVVWALADAGRPVAQLLALAVAVYGAYDILNRSARWLGGSWNKAAQRRADAKARQHPERGDNRAPFVVRAFTTAP
jgi:hypothetical protein